MHTPIKAALIGLDTMHAVEFARLLQDPVTPEKEKVSGMKITRCLRFKTPFQSEEGMDARQKYLEGLGVIVTMDFNEAVKDCDVILMTIDDPSYHLEYFLKCAALGKMLFVDKPLADSLENSRRMVEAAKSGNIRFFTSSALRFDQNIAETTGKCKDIMGAFVYGALGKAPAGSSIIWYAVHSFEILQLFMGRGATSITAIPDKQGIICDVGYKDGRHGIVRLIQNSWHYGGIIHMAEGKHQYFEYSQTVSFYIPLLQECISFFQGKSDGVLLEDSIEIMAMLEATDISSRIGMTVPVVI